MLRTDTRSLGGVSTKRLGEIARELFPYKPLSPLKLGPQTKLAADSGDGEAVDVVHEANEEFPVSNEAVEELKEQEFDAEVVRAMKREVPDDGN